MHRTLTTVLTAALLVSAPIRAFANGTPDGQNPSQELVCDEASLERSAFGLCIAFCEATDCDTHPKKAACRSLRKNFEKATGTNLFPCETPPPSCDFFCGS